MKKQIGSMLCIVFAVVCMTACDSNQKGGDKKADIINKDYQEIVLSKYSYENEFIDDEIEQIIEGYNIEGIDNVEKLIYFPIDDELSQEYKKTKYIIETITETEKCEDVIYSSSFEAPGGKAKIDRKLMISNNFENKYDEKQLESALEKVYNLDISKEYKVKKEYDLDVKEGEKQVLKAYEIVKQYDYAVKNNDKEIGEGILKKPIGILIAVCEEKN